MALPRQYDFHRREKNVNQARYVAETAFNVMSFYAGGRLCIVASIQVQPEI